MTTYPNIIEAAQAVEEDQIVYFNKDFNFSTTPFFPISSYQKFAGVLEPTLKFFDFQGTCTNITYSRYVYTNGVKEIPY